MRSRRAAEYRPVAADHAQVPGAVHAALRHPEYYVPGLAADEVAQRYGLRLEDITKLGSAENPYGPSPAAQAAVADAIGRMQIYPSWTAEPLRERLAETYGYEPRNYLCGAGETEIISVLIRAYAAQGEPILMPAPCFPMYHLFAEAEGRVADLRHEATDPQTMAVDIDAYVAAIRPEHRIVFVTNPHSPSGTWTAEGDLRRVIEAASHCLVVLDEAYVHYSGDSGGIGLVAEYPNLIVLRTFSKVYGLAGLRLGFGVAQSGIIDALLAAKPTWNVGQLQIAGGVAALGDHEFVQRTIEVICDARAYAQDLFDSKLDRFRCVEGSRSNFFLIELLDAELNSTGAWQSLLERGVITKDGAVSFRGLGQRFLRADVGFRERMDRLVAALGDLP